MENDWKVTYVVTAKKLESYRDRLLPVPDFPLFVLLRSNNHKRAYAVSELDALYC